MQNETIKVEIKPADNVNGFKVVGIKGQTTAARFTEQIEKLKRMFSSSSYSHFAQDTLLRTNQRVSRGGLK